MIIQAIGLLDDLDKELNTYAMRVREWYGWHFPELAKIIQDNILYAKAVKLMGCRDNAAKLDFSEVESSLLFIAINCVSSSLPPSVCVCVVNGVIMKSVMPPAYIIFSNAILS
jgi:RNA processing factor Prp31